METSAKASINVEEVSILRKCSHECFVHQTVLSDINVFFPFSLHVQPISVNFGRYLSNFKSIISWFRGLLKFKVQNDNISYLRQSMLYFQHQGCPDVYIKEPSLFLKTLKHRLLCFVDIFW